LIILTWQTTIDPDRVEDFEAFANTHSLPMFQKQSGCLGVLFSREGANTTTLSFWEDQASIDQLELSTSYQETVRRIQDTGFLRGEQIVRTYPIFGGYLDLDEIEGLIPK